MTSMISVEKLVYEYPSKRALHGMSFSIDAGAVVAMVGPNGAGKTTLLRCLAAVEMPFLGHVRIAGHDTEESPRECHRQIGYLSDFFGLYEDLTARKCLLHAGAMQRLDGPELALAIDQVVTYLELNDYIDVKAGTLSRGLKQRLAIAQAIIHSPRVLLMDEPASGLDPEARSKLAHLIKKLASHGMTIVVSSHILAELESYSTHMLTVEDGRLLGYTKIETDRSEQAERLITFSLVTPFASLEAHLAGKPNVVVRSVDPLSATISFGGSVEEQAALLRDLVADGLSISSFFEEQRTMQDIYFAQLEAKRAKERGKKS